MPFTTLDVQVQAEAPVVVGTPTESGWIDIRTTGGGLFVAKVTNGPTGPTLPAEVYLEVSPDNGATVYQAGYGKAGVANNGVYHFSAPVIAGTRYIRSRFLGNTGQNVTGQSDFMALTGI